MRVAPSCTPTLLRCGLAVCLAALPADVAATSTRVRCLGGGGDYFEDLANVLRWHGSLPDYGDVVLLELGEIDDDDDAVVAGSSRQAVRQGLGAHAHLDRDGGLGTCGLYLQDRARGGDAVGEVTLLYGRGVGDRAQLGLLVGLSLAETADEGPSALVFEDARRDLWFGLGARCELGAATYLDAAAELRGARRCYRDRDPEETPLQFEDERWGSFALRARLFWAPREEVVLVPLVAYARENRPTELLAGVPPGLLDAWSLRSGLGLNLLPAPDLMGVASCEYWEQRERGSLPVRGEGGTQGEPEAMGLLYANHGAFVVVRAGLEARISSWLTLRAGAASVPALGGESPRPRLADLPEAFDLTFGLGIHLGDLDADLLLNDDAPFNLGSVLTNAGGQERATFSSMTIAYRF